MRGVDRRLRALAAALSLASRWLSRRGASGTVPAPESVLGFVPGEDRQLADWGQVLEYLKALDAASGA